MCLLNENKGKYMGCKLLSFVVPVYNVEKYLKQCLDSLVLDVDFDYEIIIVNDGSKDDSECIIAEFQTEHLDIVKYIKQENRGLSAARNRGIEVAEGKYITFIDSDDFIIKEKYLQLLDSIRESKCDFIIGNYFKYFDGRIEPHKFNKNKRKTLLMNSITSEEYLKLMYDYFTDDFDVEAVTQIYSLEFLKQNNLRFYEGIIHEDTMFMFEVLSKANTLCVRDIAFYAYRMREGSIMHSINEKHYKSLAIIVKRVLQILKSKRWNYRSVNSYLINMMYEIGKYSMDLITHDKEIYSALSIKGLTAKAFIKKQVLLFRIKMLKTKDSI